MGDKVWCFIFIVHFYCLKYLVVQYNQSSTDRWLKKLKLSSIAIISLIQNCAILYDLFQCLWYNSVKWTVMWGLVARVNNLLMSTFGAVNNFTSRGRAFISYLRKKTIFPVHPWGISFCVLQDRWCGAGCDKYNNFWQMPIKINLFGKITYNWISSYAQPLEDKLVVAALQLLLKNMKKLIVSSISQ